MLSLVLRASRRAAPRRTLFLHQHLRATHATRLASTDAGTTKSKRPKNLRTAYVRTWGPLANIADAYAMIRVIERKYGKVIGVHFLKDFEVPTNYQTISWIIFQDPKSVQRIPEKGFEFTIPVTGVQKEHHEIGMDDIEHLAQEGDYEEGFQLATVDPETNPKVIGGKIMRSEKDFEGEGVDSRLFQGSAREVMHSFLQWGGFSKLTPLDRPRQIRDEDLFTGNAGSETQTHLDSIHMRAALQLAASATRSQNPAVVNRERGASTSTSRTTGTIIPARTVDRRESSQSLGDLVSGSGDASQTRDNSNASSTEETETVPSASHSDSIPGPSTSTSTSSPPPAASTTSADSSSSSASPSFSPSSDPIPSTIIPPLPRKKSPPTPAQIAEKEALERQLEVARQFREQVVAPRRKQPKPALNSKPKRPKPEFFAEDALPSNEPQVKAKEPTRPGVLTRLWGMFGRK